MEDCLFCKIVQGDIPNYTVYQNDKTLAFLDINPNSLGHTLVIPKQHAHTIIDMDDEYMEDVFRTVKRVVKGIQTALHPDGFNLVVNQGETAGQIINHFHCHIIPRNEGDGIQLIIEGITPSQEEFQDLAGKISAHIP